jgi:Restriction Enzyme Adenine Methylase Associated
VEHERIGVGAKFGDDERRADFDKRYLEVAPSVEDHHDEDTGEIRNAVGGKDHTGFGESEGRLRVRMRDLIAAGVINPPVEIEVTFKGQRLTATIDDDGLIHFDGETYSSPSHAAGIARNKVNGPPSDGRAHWQTNGWTFWRFREPTTGSLEPIARWLEQLKGREH